MCGRCANVQTDGTPIQRVQIAGVTRRLIRCQACANESVNFEQLERGDTQTERTFAPLSDFLAKMRTRVDWKAAAAGEDRD